MSRRGRGYDKWGKHVPISHRLTYHNVGVMKWYVPTCLTAANVGTRAVVPAAERMMETEGKVINWNSVQVTGGMFSHTSTTSVTTTAIEISTRHIWLLTNRDPWTPLHDGFKSLV